MFVLVTLTILCSTGWPTSRASFRFWRRCRIAVSSLSASIFLFESQMVNTKTVFQIKKHFFSREKQQRFEISSNRRLVLQICKRYTQKKWKWKFEKMHTSLFLSIKLNHGRCLTSNTGSHKSLKMKLIIQTEAKNSWSLFFSVFLCFFTLIYNSTLAHAFSQLQPCQAGFCG